jgi:hypothetical protein
MPDTRTVTRLDNNPPDPIRDATFDAAMLDSEDKSLFDRLLELELGAKQIPEIADEAVATRAVSFVAQCRLAVADLGRVHKRRKKPLLDLGRILDARYLRRRDTFQNTVIRPIETRVEAYRRRLEAAQRQRDAELRRKAEEDREKHAAEAQRLQAEAAVKEAAGNRRAAVDLAGQAQAAREAALRDEALAALPDAPVRLHGEYGSTAFSVTRWTFYIADPEALPAQYWKPDEEAIQAELDAAVRMGKEPPQIPGVEFTCDTEGRIRRC